MKPVKYYQWVSYPVWASCPTLPYLLELFILTSACAGRRSLRSASKGELSGNRNRNRNLKTSKALLKSQAHQGTSLFTSAATNQRGVSKGGSREAQVRIPEYQEGTE